MPRRALSRPLDPPRRTPLLPAIAAALLTALAPRAAEASACCGTGHGLGQRLALAERAAAAFALRGQERLGAVHVDGSYASMAAGDLDREARAEVSWLVRVSSRAELGAAVPMLMTWRRLAGSTGAGGGVGDVTIHGRYALVPLGGDGWIPSIALTGGVLVPTGRPLREARDALGADATGLGVAEFRPGVSIEQSWMSGWWAAVAASVGLRTASTHADGRAVRLAPRVRLLGAAGPWFPWGLSIAAGLLHEREAAPSIGGRAAPDGDRRRTAATVFAAYDIDARWALTGSAEVDLPVPGLGKNELVNAAVGVGVRYAWGNHD